MRPLRAKELTDANNVWLIEELNVAWDQHEITVEGFDEVLSFFFEFGSPLYLSQSGRRRVQGQGFPSILIVQTSKIMHNFNPTQYPMAMCRDVPVDFILLQLQCQSFGSRTQSISDCLKSVVIRFWSNFWVRKRESKLLPDWLAVLPPRRVCCCCCCYYYWKKW